MKRLRKRLPKRNIEKTKSSYARHLMINNHNHTEFDTNLRALHICQKSRFMDALEGFEMYNAFKNKNNSNNNAGDNILNNQLCSQSNTVPYSFKYNRL